MQTEYPVMYEKRCCGTATITQEGMYYRIRCHVDGNVPTPVRVLLRTENGDTDLGLCFREGIGFALTARLPVTAVGEAALMFHVYNKKKTDVIFIPVDEKQEFPYLAMVKKARFAVEDSKTGIYLYDITE